jgi:hypothetical protein
MLALASGSWMILDFTIEDGMLAKAGIRHHVSSIKPC